MKDKHPIDISSCPEPCPLLEILTEISEELQELRIDMKYFQSRMTALERQLALLAERE